MKKKCIKEKRAGSFARRGLALGLAGLLAAAQPLSNALVYAEDGGAGTEITEDEMEALLSSSDTEETATTRSRVSVHDPSIVKDTESGTYYVFGSHMGTASSTDLENWTTLYTENNTECNLFGVLDENGEVVAASYEEAFKENVITGTVTGGKIEFGTFDASAWIADNTVSGNMWAPDVIYNETMEKWCMYLSLNGADWDSVIILLTADSIDGPYVYQGPVVYSGFSTADSDDSYKNTDLEVVLGTQDSLPEQYSQRTDTSSGTWGDYWPHAIDPCVFYDDEGNLWMSYGSWSGGICLLQLDENTGLRDYSVTYESDYSDKGQAWTSDAYFGTKIAGGCYVSGEGSYIQQIGDYYYLFISYGFYSPEGGYSMRVFRSETVDGDYVDADGNSAVYSTYEMNYGAYGSENGNLLMSSYQWSSMDLAETAQGHNSVLVDEDGSIYLVYHTKFTDGTASHELRVHQLFVNEDGWLVAAPYEYDGESLSEEGYTLSSAAGDYDVILHNYDQDYANLEYATPSEVTLASDGSITGTYTGTWSVDGYNITLTVDGTEYKGVLIEQKVDNEAYSTLCFTAASESGLCIWGSMQQDAKTVIAQNVQSFDFGIPEATYTDLTLPTTGNSGTVISWASSNESVLASDGTIGTVTEDTDVTLTATISKGDYYYNLYFTVTVKPGGGTFTEKTLVASYFTDEKVDLSNYLDGSLSVSNPYYNGTAQGIDLSGGVSIEFDVESTGDVRVLATILSFMGGGRLYFTPGSYLGYNATGGYFDANLYNYGLVEDYIGDGGHVRIDLLSDGFEVYVDGELAYDETILDDAATGSGTLTNYSNVLTWLNESATTLYFGYGSFWGNAGYDEALCTLSNVECYVYASRELDSVCYELDELELTSSSDITYVENPFYGKYVDSLYIEYTIHFADDAAKTGWDGLFSFYNSSTTGRVSIQSNPYICYNDANGSWVDINYTGLSDATKWAASAETGRDYKITILLTSDSLTTTVDGEAITTADQGSASYATVIDYLSGCDYLTLGVGDAKTSYWATELCTITNLVIASSAKTEEDTSDSTSSSTSSSTVETTTEEEEDSSDSETETDSSADTDAEDANWEKQTGVKAEADAETGLVVTVNTKKDGTATITKIKATTDKTVKVPSSVTVDGEEYTVTKISNKAFAKATEVTKIVLPDTITTIGAKAFSGAKTVKTIVVNSTGTVKVSKTAFKGLNTKNITVKVNVSENGMTKKEYKSFKATLKAKGFKGTIKKK